MKIAEFRRNIRKYLDSLRDTDDEIILERFGQQWKLTWIGGADNPRIEIEPAGRVSSVEVDDVTISEVCPGSHTLRMNCGRLGCPY